MGPLGAPRTLGVVVVHKPDGEVDELPAVRELADQVDELLVVENGPHLTSPSAPLGVGGGRVRVISFTANRGTAAAWNAALARAVDAGYGYLYLLDQDSVPAADAVASALEEIGRHGVVAVVQPPAGGTLGLVPFPWNTVASGSLYDVRVLDQLGGFDEALFVDEVDHEMLARLVGAGYAVRPLARATISHRAGSPKEVRVFRLNGWILGHSVERHRLRGYSTGLLVRRYVRRAPATSFRLLLREAFLTSKDLAAGERRCAWALLTGLGKGMATSRPPARAAERACPYCQGQLLGSMAAVPDWVYENGQPADVYECMDCGALAAGRVPSADEIGSWYADYYTHRAEAHRRRVWSRFWPTPRRRRELDRLRWFFASPEERGRFLEVGTGSGERLVQFAGAGWEVVGQDLDPKAGHLARDRGIEVHRRPVRELVGQEKPFDLVGLSHVLEHATDQADILDACAALLAPGGRLCVVCPNGRALGRCVFGRWWFGLDQPRHLAIPTLDSLERLTTRLGLRTVHVETVSTNAAVILGGSLGRWFHVHLRPGLLRGVARFVTAGLGQALGRAAILVDDRLGEEIVWVGQPDER